MSGCPFFTSGTRRFASRVLALILMLGLIATVFGPRTGRVTAAGDPVLVATIPLPGGALPLRTAVDTVHHLAYVTASGTNSLYVVDTVNDVVLATIAVGAQPTGVGIDTVARKVYVANYADDTVSVVDAETNAVTRTLTGYFQTPEGVAVNETTNRVYDTNIRGGGTLNPGFVTVIDSTTDTIVTTIAVGSDPRTIAVNPITNRVYVPAAANDPGLSVIDGATNQVIETVSLGVSVTDVGVDTGLNRIYVTNQFLGALYAIDGATDSILTTLSFNGAGAVIVDSDNHRAYMHGFGDALGMWVIDTDQNIALSATTLASSGGPQLGALDRLLQKLYIPLNSGQAVAVVKVGEANIPPAVAAGGPYTVDEGSSITLFAAGSNPEGGPLLFTWDLDNDGAFETPGQSVTFSAANLNGPDSYPIAVQVTDDSGLTATDQTAVTVLNVAPTVGGGLDASLIEGQTLAVSGSFSDPGPDNWTATVDYGDGTGVKPLVLSGTTFALSHVYPSAGVYTVAVTVNDGVDAGSDTLLVTVLMPQQATENLSDDVDALVSVGVLSHGQGNALTSKLDAAIGQMDRGNIRTAGNQLQAFVNQVNAFIRSGVLSPAEGQPLIDTANEIIAALG